jgi:hypothetical protein
VHGTRANGGKNGGGGQVALQRTHRKETPSAPASTVMESTEPAWTGAAGRGEGGERGVRGEAHRKGEREGAYRVRAVPRHTSVARARADAPARPSTVARTAPSAAGPSPTMTRRTLIRCSAEKGMCFLT